MEEDLEILQKALSNLDATESKNDKTRNYEGLYKNWGKLGNQEERRNQLLEVQKSNRKNKIDNLRGILELVTEVEDYKLFKPYNKVSYRPEIYVAGFHKTSRSYNNVLMLSEWMVEKPKDFSEDWYIVPCPKGTRLLVVANKGRTKFYNKYGNFKFERHTALPGGRSHNRRSCCVLDGFFCDKTNTLYLLDVLAWNNQTMTDGETEFRHFWLKTQLEELIESKTINKINKVIIKVLPMIPCTEQNLSLTLNKYPQFENNMPPLDGLLFYHKRAQYVAGENPLVGWLYPYMVPEVLGENIKVHPSYMQEMPEGYVNQADFIQKFEEELAIKTTWRSSRSSEMETDSNKYENPVEANGTDDNTSTSMEQEEKSDQKQISIEQEEK